MCAREGYCPDYTHRSVLSVPQEAAAAPKRICAYGLLCRRHWIDMRARMTHARLSPYPALSNSDARQCIQALLQTKRFDITPMMLTRLEPDALKRKVWKVYKTKMRPLDAKSAVHTLREYGSRFIEVSDILDFILDIFRFIKNSTCPGR